MSFETQGVYYNANGFQQEEMPVAPFDKAIQNATEKLYEDERLRSNLADDEAKIVFDWALGRISAQVGAARDEATAKLLAQKELARVRPVLAAINALAKTQGPPRLAAAVAAVEPILTAGRPLSRAETMTLLMTFADKIWQGRSNASSK